MAAVTFNLDVRGRRVLVLSGGVESLAAVTGLLAAGAEVTVRTGEPVTTLRDLAERQLIRIDAEASATGWGLVLDPDSRPAEQPAGAERVGATGQVVLVGGGPGDPGLITVAGLEAVRAADVIVVDRLAPLAVLDRARPDAMIIDVGKIPRGEFTGQEQINQLLVTHALAGRRVVRLKGGDSFVFGRGGEECQACVEAGIAVRVIPGVSSAIAAPALAGIPVTHRTMAQGFTVVTGHAISGQSVTGHALSGQSVTGHAISGQSVTGHAISGQSVTGHALSGQSVTADPTEVNWAALAASNTTLVILMGVANLSTITASLLTNRLPAETPAAVVADAGLPSMRTVHGDLGSIAQLATDAGIRAPAVVVIGAVAAIPQLLAGPSHASATQD